MCPLLFFREPIVRLAALIWWQQNGCKRTDDLTDTPSLFIKAGGYVKEAYETIASTKEL